MNKLSESYQVTIHWIKAHVNNKGNEIADRVAKTGSKLTGGQAIPISTAYMKSVIKERMYREWNRRWQQANGCRQTFQIFPCTDTTKSKTIARMGRKDLGMMVRYLTGHAHLGRHNKIAQTPGELYYDLPQRKYEMEDPDENLIGPFDKDITCRLCKIEGKEETPFHLATECLRAWSTRRELLGSYSFERDDFRWHPDSLLKFF